MAIPYEVRRDALVQGVLDDVQVELEQAIAKHGFDRTPLSPHMTDEKRFIVLAEEVGEVARALTYDEGEEEKLVSELIQVAAMAVASVAGMRRSGILAYQALKEMK